MAPVPEIKVQGPDVAYAGSEEAARKIIRHQAGRQDDSQAKTLQQQLQQLQQIVQNTDPNNRPGGMPVEAVNFP